MGGITVGEIAGFIALVAGIITGLGVIFKFVASNASAWLRRELEPIADKVDDIAGQIEDESVERCKDFIVRTLSAVEKGEQVTSEELQRFYENYGHYTATGHNGYIKKKVEALEKSGKLQPVT